MLRRPALAVPTLLALAALTGCGAAFSSPAGTDESDRVADVVATAISWPRQESVMGYARAAADTTAGQDGRLSVVEVTQLEAADSTEAFGELTLRVHLEGAQSGFVETEPVTACYRARFGHYGAVGGPTRVDCPDDTEPADIPPRPR